MISFSAEFAVIALPPDWYKGIPYGKRKGRGDVGAPAKWAEAVVRQTRRLPKVDGPCMLRVTFLLPPDKFPADLPFGMDLDNLLKGFLDPLGETVFKNAPAGIHA